MFEEGHLIGLLSLLSGKFVEKETVFYKAKWANTTAKMKQALEGSKRSIYLSDDSDDSFNLLFNVLVAQTETNEIDNEFN